MPFHLKKIGLTCGTFILTLSSACVSMQRASSHANLNVLEQNTIESRALFDALDSIGRSLAADSFETRALLMENWNLEVATHQLESYRVAVLSNPKAIFVLRLPSEADAPHVGNRTQSLLRISGVQAHLNALLTENVEKQGSSRRMVVFGSSTWHQAFASTILPGLRKRDSMVGGIQFMRPLSNLSLDSDTFHPGQNALAPPGMYVAVPGA